MAKNPVLHQLTEICITFVFEGGHWKVAQSIVCHCSLSIPPEIRGFLMLSGVIERLLT